MRARLIVLLVTLMLAGCHLLQPPPELGLIYYNNRQGDPAEKMVALLVTFGIPIALGIDCVLLIVYGASLGEIGEPMMVTRYLMEVIEGLWGGR